MSEKKSSSKEKLLEVRKNLKKKTPEFKRHDTHKHKRLRVTWRRPKGHQAKMRLQKRGKPKRVEPGYRGPREVRGLSRNGLERVKVNNVSEIEVLDPKGQGALISGTMGLRKKVAVVTAALDKGITILNLKEPKAFLDGVKARFTKKKEEKKAKAEQKKASDKKKGKEGIDSVVATEEKKEPSLKKAKASTKTPVKKKGEAKKEKKTEAPATEEKKKQKARDKVLTKKT